MPYPSGPDSGSDSAGAPASVADRTGKLRDSGKAAWWLMEQRRGRAGPGAKHVFEVAPGWPDEAAESPAAEAGGAVRVVAAARAG